MLSQGDGYGGSPMGGGTGEKRGTLLEIWLSASCRSCLYSMGKFLREMLQETSVSSPKFKRAGDCERALFFQFATMAPCSEIQGVPENVPFNQTGQTKFSPDSLCCFGYLLYPITEFKVETGSFCC